MRILCTFPGKFGDLLWALPTVRAISRRVGTPVDLIIAAPFASIAPLIEAQPYIGQCGALSTWQVMDTAPISPRIPPVPYTPVSNPVYDAVLHLGYRDWPLPDVAMHTRLTALGVGQACGLLDRPFSLDEWSYEPWITPPFPRFPPIDIAFGWSDEHFELKFGVSELLSCRRDRHRHWDENGYIITGPWGRRTFQYCPGPDSRWVREAHMGPSNWVEQTRVLKAAKVVVACNSALHVLAVAVGTPVVMMEPQPMRHNDVFYPLGKVGPQVTLVTGVDGRPTFDARHVADAVDRVLTQRKESTS